MSRQKVFTGAQWALLEPLQMNSVGKRSRPFCDYRHVLEGIVFCYRTGGPWRVPRRFGPWKTLWKRHARFSKDGTCDRILEQMLAQADAAGGIDWQLSSDSTVSRVHLHDANLSRQVAVGLPSHTGTPRTTGDSRSSRLIMRLVVAALAQRPSCTRWLTATARCCRCSRTGSESLAAAPGGPEPGLMRSRETRRTPAAATQPV